MIAVGRTWKAEPCSCTTLVLSCAHHRVGVICVRLERIWRAAALKRISMSTLLQYGKSFSFSFSFFIWALFCLCSLVCRVYTPCTYHMVNMVSLRDRSYLSYAELSTWLTAHTGSSATARPSEASTARSLTHHPHSAATCAHGRTRQSVLTPTRPRPGSCPMPQPVLDHQFARPCRR
jgi:hypothetical protein